MRFAHFYWKYTNLFRGDFFWWGEIRGTGLLGRIFPWRNFSWVKRIFHEVGAGFPGIDEKMIRY